MTAYIWVTMHKAEYEILPDDDTVYGEIPDFQGVYANAGTLEACCEELEEVFEIVSFVPRFQEPRSTSRRQHRVDHQESVVEAPILHAVASSSVSSTTCVRVPSMVSISASVSP